MILALALYALLLQALPPLLLLTYLDLANPIAITRNQYLLLSHCFNVIKVRIKSKHCYQCILRIKLFLRKSSITLFTTQEKITQVVIPE